MKFLLLFLCSLSYGFLMAQDCREHLLMQKGVQLEYRVLWPTADSGKPVCRLLFEVSEVKDSAGRSWSTIIKRGIGISDSSRHCERKIVLQCDGTYLRIPFDFYSYDTLFTQAFYPLVQHNDPYGYVTAFTPMADSITYAIPLELDCTICLPGEKKEVNRIEIGGYLPYGRCFRPQPFVNTYHITYIALEGKEIVTTPTGTFGCYKICTEETVDYKPDPIKYWLYFNSKIGLVKLPDSYFYHGAVELTGIRK